MIDGIPNRPLFFYQKDIIDEERLPQKWHSGGVTAIALTDWSYFLQEQQDQVPFIDFRFWQTGAPCFQETQILDFSWSSQLATSKCGRLILTIHIYIYIMYLNHWIGGFQKSGYLLNHPFSFMFIGFSHELSHPMLAWGTIYPVDLRRLDGQGRLSVPAKVPWIHWGGNPNGEIHARLCPPVISWFINPINYRYIYHKP